MRRNHKSFRAPLSLISNFIFVLKVYLSILIFVFLYSGKTAAQLSFCQGELGPPIFNEDFGTGTTNGPPLGPQVTSYQYVNSNTEDGQYTVSRDMQQLPNWHNTTDHTGNTNGKALIVNAGFTIGVFYEIPINGLCGNTSYEFSAWLLNTLDGNNNPCPPNEIPVNVRFEIWDETDTNLLSSGSTGNIFASGTVNWQQFGLTFTSTNDDGVILKMLNNGVGGCGNDLAIDDIQFRACGDVTGIDDSSGNNTIEVCEEDTPTSITITATAQTSVFNSPEYQWQQSTDNSTFTDIPGETNQTFTDNTIISTTYYRVKVAEDEANLDNDQCNNFSEVYSVLVNNPQAPTSAQTDFVICDGDTVVLMAIPQNGENISWFTEASGGQPILENASQLTVENIGEYFAETTTIEGCSSINRLQFNVTAGSIPQVNDENITICDGETAILDAGVPNQTYLWNTGETTQTISVTEANVYTVEVTSNDGCTAVKTITLNTVPSTNITDVTVVGNSITILVDDNNSNVEFSIDGQNFQTSNSFSLPATESFTVFVRDTFGCFEDSRTISPMDIPTFFTPNGDGFNDVWQLRGLETVRGIVYIFDRYGKLLKTISQRPYIWDGTINGQSLPSSDYWYRIISENEVTTGHVSLLR